MVIKNMSLNATVWLIDVFLIVFGQQWSSMTQRNNIYQALIHTQYLLVEQFTVDLGLLMGVVTIRKISLILIF